MLQCGALWCDWYPVIFLIRRTLPCSPVGTRVASVPYGMNGGTKSTRGGLWLFTSSRVQRAHAEQTSVTEVGGGGAPAGRLQLLTGPADNTAEF